MNSKPQTALHRHSMRPTAVALSLCLSTLFWLDDCTFHRARRWPSTGWQVEQVSPRRFSRFARVSSWMTSSVLSTSLYRAPKWRRWTRYQRWTWGSRSDGATATFLYAVVKMSRSVGLQVASDSRMRRIRQDAKCTAASDRMLNGSRLPENRVGEASSVGIGAPRRQYSLGAQCAPWDSGIPDLAGH